MSNALQPKMALFRRGSWREARRIGEVLREETIGGALLLAAAVVALAWANSPWSAAYESLRTLAVGPSFWHLHLDLATWAADGLLAVFFFVAGLELKREFTAGDLRDPRRAAVPVAAAVGGIIVPALIYTAFTAGADGGALKGWAIPGATDIAFALAVLAVAGRHLPSALRTFLLTLAVVDDLLAIVIIAVFYTSGLSVLPLAAALVPLAVFAALARRRPGSWWLLLPLAAVTWALVHASGVHATVAGVLLAFTVPVGQRAARDGPGTGPGPGPGTAGQFEHRLRPVSAGLAVPVFALLSAGVTLGGISGLRTALSDPVALGVVAGLVAGKTAGIFAATWLVARFTHATLDEGLSWTDVAGMAMLGGIGFTVSLLISELAFGTGGGREDHAKVAVLTGSLIAALLATIVLRLRNRAYRRIDAAETVDAGHDGIPDVYAADPGHDESAGSQAACRLAEAAVPRGGPAHSNSGHAISPWSCPEPGRRTAGLGPEELFTSGLSASEYTLLGEVGFEPLSFVTGSSVYHVGLQAARWSRSHELQVQAVQWTTQGIWRPGQRLDHPRAVTCEDAVKCGGELAISVADQEPEAARPTAEIHQEVAGLLGGPGPGASPGGDSRCRVRLSADSAEAPLGTAPASSTTPRAGRQDPGAVAARARIASIINWTAVVKFCGSSRAGSACATPAMPGYSPGGRVR